MARAGTDRRTLLYDVTRTNVIRQLTSDELNQMAAKGMIGWFRDKKQRLCACVQPIPMQSRTSDPIHSRPSLVMTDSELNAEGAFADAKGYGGVRKYGLNRYGAVDEDIVGNRIDQSMSKLEIWPDVHDDRNVAVCAGKVFGITQMSRAQLASL